MKRIEDIKEFEDIDTYYGVLGLVEDVFQDRVETHKHLVTANKEIERLNKDLKDACEVIERLKEDKKKVREYIEKNTQWYNKELGLVEMEGYNSNRIPVVYLYGLLEILDKVEE